VRDGRKDDVPSRLLSISTSISKTPEPCKKRKRSEVSVKSADWKGMLSTGKLNGQPVAWLKELLESEGLTKSGNKAALIQRIKEHAEEAKSMEGEASLAGDSPASEVEGDSSVASCDD
jgi:hypothetical protein